MTNLIAEFRLTLRAFPRDAVRATRIDPAEALRAE